MVTPTVELGTATVTTAGAAGAVDWRGDTYAADVGTAPVGALVTVLRVGGRVVVFGAAGGGGGGGAYLPLAGGTLTGDLTLAGPARVHLDPKEDPGGWGEIRSRELAGEGGMMLVAFPPGADPDTGGKVGLLIQAGAGGATAQVWVPFAVLEGITSRNGLGGAATFTASKAGDVAWTGRVTAPGVPYAMAAGRQAMTLTNADTATAVVPFPSNLFTPGLFPIITVSPAGGTTPVDLFVSNVSNTGYTLTMKSRTGPITLTQNVAWHAVQMTATTAESPATTQLPAPAPPGAAQLPTEGQTP